MKAATRASAAAALCELGPKALPAIPALIEALGDADECVAHDAGLALSRMGRKALPALVEALSHEKQEVRRRSALACFWMEEETEPAVPALVAVVAKEGEAWEVKEWAARAVSVAGRGALDRFPSCRTLLIRAVSDFVPLLADRGSDAFFCAWNALVNLGSLAVPAVTRHLDPQQQELCAACIQVLGDMDEEAAEAVPALSGILSNPEADSDIRAEAARALSAIGLCSESLEALLERLWENSDEAVRSSSARALLTLSQDEGTRCLALCRILEHGEYCDKSHAIDLLEKRALPLRGILARLKDPAHCRGALRALASFDPQDEGSRLALLEAFETCAGRNRCLALRLLGRMHARGGGRTGEDWLTPILIRAQLDSSAAVRGTALSVLADAGPLREVHRSLLRRAAGDPSPHVRLEAASWLWDSDPGQACSIVRSLFRDASPGTAERLADFLVHKAIGVGPLRKPEELGFRLDHSLCRRGRDAIDGQALELLFEMMETGRAAHRARAMRSILGLSSTHDFWERLYPRCVPPLPYGEDIDRFVLDRTQRTIELHGTALLRECTEIISRFGRPQQEAARQVLLDFLRQGLASDDEEILCAAVRGVLVQAGKEDCSARQEALSVLGRLGRSRRADIRKRVVKLLSMAAGEAHLGKEAVSRLEALLGDPAKTVRILAARNLTYLGKRSPELAALLASRLEELHPGVSKKGCREQMRKRMEAGGFRSLDFLRTLLDGLEEE